jgi:hypothetical protein
MKLGIKATVDVIFKALFGDERHPGLTRSLVNDILREIGRPPAVSLKSLIGARSTSLICKKGIRIPC